MDRIVRELLPILIALIFIGCSKNEEQPVEPCPISGGLSIGLRVKVYDKLSGEFIDEGIEVKAIDGNYSERLILVTGGNTIEKSYFGVPGNRPGIYRVNVQGSGYMTYNSNPIDIVLNETGCHVIQQLLEIELQPL